MASACVNNIGVPPENFIDCTPSAFPAYGWRNPRVSFSREYTDEESKVSTAAVVNLRPTVVEKKPSSAPDAAKDGGDFEFLLHDPVAMLTADELFSDGKLVPLQLSAACPAKATGNIPAVSPEEGVRSPEAGKAFQDAEVVSVSSDPYLFSPKAPRCSTRWRELLGLKKRYQSSKATSTSDDTTSSSSSNTAKSIRYFLHRHSKSISALTSSASDDASLNLPLLKDSDCESLSISSSRLSLSSSLSSHDHDDLPRLSLDADIKPRQSHISLSRCSSGPKQGLIHKRVKMVKPRMASASVAENRKSLIDHPSVPTSINRVGRSPICQAHQDPSTTITRGMSVDSPRLSSSGKIVFQGLERSSSSPSSFYGGPRNKHRGMERSYSANVRVTPVLNVPVCSLRGSSVFGLFSSQLQKEGNSGSNSGTSKAHHHHHHRTGRTRR